MTRGRWIALGAVVVAVLVLAGVLLVVSGGSGAGSGPGGGRPQPPPLPLSMAAVGDSVTQAFDVNANGLLRDNPQESWSTGDDLKVNSHFARVRRVQGDIAANVHNDAVSGAKMTALDAQLAFAAAQHVGYVTVLMGANDLCTSTVASMTATGVFRQDFHDALAGFFRADPGAHVLVASLPNLLALWQTLHGNAVAEIVWGTAHICQSMLAASGTDQQRQMVAGQEQADNGVLAATCEQFANCRFDGGAVYRTALTAADISTVDFFHPSIAGEAKLAAVTWAAGFWPTTP